MKFLDLTTIIRQYCRINKRYALVFYFQDDYDTFDELRKRVSCLEREWNEKITQAVLDGLLIVTCKTEEEHDQIFDVEYKDPVVYCWTCGPDGVILTENT